MLDKKKLFYYRLYYLNRLLKMVIASIESGVITRLFPLRRAGFAISSTIGGCNGISSLQADGSDRASGLSG